MPIAATASQRRGTGSEVEGERDGARGAWLVVFRRYLILAAGGNFVWELTHLPLYTLWQTAAPQQIAWFVVRCTVGDMLIALSSLVLALLIVNDPAWPARSYRQTGSLR